MKRFCPTNSPTVVILSRHTSFQVDRVLSLTLIGILRKAVKRSGQVADRMFISQRTKHCEILETDNKDTRGVSGLGQRVSFRRGVQSLLAVPFNSLNEVASTGLSFDVGNSLSGPPRGLVSFVQSD